MSGLDWLADAVLLAVGASVAFWLPVLIYRPEQVFHRLFGWHYVLLFHAPTRNPVCKRRVRQQGDYTYVMVNGREYRLLEKGVCYPTRCHWRPLTWNEAHPQAGDPVLGSLRELRELEKAIRDGETYGQAQ